MASLPWFLQNIFMAISDMVTTRQARENCQAENEP